MYRLLGNEGKITPVELLTNQQNCGCDHAQAQLGKLQTYVRKIDSPKNEAAIKTKHLKFSETEVGKLANNSLPQPTNIDWFPVTEQSKTGLYYLLFGLINQKNNYKT